MPQFSTKRRVPHAATDMFDLVADVEKYPQFVPLCSAMKVKSRTEKDGVTVLVADMTVAYKIIRETSRAASRSIGQSCGFLSNISADRSSACRTAGVLCRSGRTPARLEFFIDYEFRSRALAAVMGAVFDAAFPKFAVAFERRADEIHGRPA